MRKLLIVWLLVFADSWGSAAAKPCKPEVVVHDVTNTSATIKWTCTASADTTPVESYGLAYVSLHKPQERYVLAFPDSSSTSYPLSDLHFGETYEISVEAIDQTGVTSRSEDVQVNLGGIVPTQPCEPNLKVLQKTHNSINLEWECNTAFRTPISVFQLRWATEDWSDTLLQDIPYNQNRIILTDLKCGKTYIIYIEAHDRNGKHARSQEIRVLVGEEKITGYPSNEEFIMVGEDSITLKVDVWKSDCPFKSFSASARATDGQEPTHREVNTGNRLIFSRLRPNTAYVVELDHKAANKEKAVYEVKTLCGEKTPKPEFPISKEEIIEEHETYAVIHLDKFVCYRNFTIEYRESASKPWIQLYHNITAEQKSILIPQLHPETFFQLGISGEYKYGFFFDVYDVSLKPNVCGSWILFRNKCIKPVQEAGLLTNPEAVLICQNYLEHGQFSSILTIKSKEELDLLPIVITKQQFTGYAWLGLVLNDDGAYHWDDGPEITFSNWGNTSVYEKDSSCGRIMLHESRFQQGTPKEWQKTRCDLRNYVICEKPHLWSLSRMQKEFANMEKKQALFQKKFTALESQLNL